MAHRLDKDRCLQRIHYRIAVLPVLLLDLGVFKFRPTQEEQLPRVPDVMRIRDRHAANLEVRVHAIHALSDREHFAELQFDLIAADSLEHVRDAAAFG